MVEKIEDISAAFAEEDQAALRRIDRLMTGYVMPTTAQAALHQSKLWELTTKHPVLDLLYIILRANETLELEACKHFGYNAAMHPFAKAGFLKLAEQSYEKDFHESYGIREAFEPVLGPKITHRLLNEIHPFYLKHCRLPEEGENSKSDSNETFVKRVESSSAAFNAEEPTLSDLAATLRRVHQGAFMGLQRLSALHPHADPTVRQILEARLEMLARAALYTETHAKIPLGSQNRSA